MINPYENTQNAFSLLQNIGSLCATPGLNEDTLKTANDRIQEILNGAVKKAVTEVNAKASGITTNLQ